MFLKSTLSRKRQVISGRRQAIAAIFKTTALIPFVSLINIPMALAEELPHVTGSDPIAKALKYVPDATIAERTDKMGVKGDQQSCSNCNFLVGDEGQWRPCQLFPGKTVNIDGWCTSWTPKS